MSDLEKKTYDLSWEDLGDLSIGRPNLGDKASVTIYRLLEYSFKDVLSKEFGLEKAKEIFVKAGHLAGEQFAKNVLNIKLGFNEFVAELQEKFVSLNIGILRIEEADSDKLTFTVTVSEDLDCSGLPLLGETVCDYDEGFLAGVFFAYTGKKFEAREVDCWATGDRTCRFKINPL